MLEPPSNDATSEEISITTRNKLRILALQLGLKNDSLPEAIFLEDVKCEDNESRSLGGFADIFCGTYKGEKVALKRPRYYTKFRDAQKSKLRQVRRDIFLAFIYVDQP